MKKHSLVLAISWVAVQVVAQDVPLGPYEATYFYYGYLHEFETMTDKGRPQGIFIGGSRCRRAKCTFDQFLNHATAGNRGAYRGGVEVDGSSDGDSPWDVSQSLIDNGMRTVDWQVPRLIAGAGSRRTVEDAIMYVSNTAQRNQGEVDGTDHLYQKIVEAFVHLQEAQAGAAANEFKKELEKLVDFDVPMQKYPEDAEDAHQGHTVVRDAVDVINLVRTWVFEVPDDARKYAVDDLHNFARSVINGYNRVWGGRDFAPGARMQSMMLRMQACYGGRSWAPYLQPPRWM